MKHLMALLSIITLSSLLSSCSIFPESKQVTVYKLPETSITAKTVQPNNWSLRVNRPQANDILNSTHIIMMLSNHQVSIYPNVRWSDSIPNMLRDRIINAFIEDGRTNFVSSDINYLNADIELSGHLQSFGGEMPTNQPKAHILYDAQLINPQSKKVIAYHRFNIIQLAKSNSADDMITALGLASDQLANQLITWTESQEALISHTLKI